LFKRHTLFNRQVYLRVAISIGLWFCVLLFHAVIEYYTELADHVNPGHSFWELLTLQSDLLEVYIFTFVLCILVAFGLYSGIITAKQKRLEQQLTEYSDNLETKVKERTKDLEVEVDERRQAEEKVRSISKHMERVREEERTNVAREIHDELGQMLMGLKIDLGELDETFPREHEKIDSMSEHVDSLMNSVRRISTELRPSILDDLGIIDALEWQAAEFEKRTGIKCEFPSCPDDIVLNKGRSSTVFRIFQETLTNIARHANASQVEITVELEGSDLVLRIMDNGKGFVKENTYDPSAFGLIGMQERAQFWEGHLNITSTLGEGTTVQLGIPLPDKENSDD
jgi:signal transduction histidine kinase